MAVALNQACDKASNLAKAFCEQAKPVAIGAMEKATEIANTHLANLKVNTETLTIVALATRSEKMDVLLKGAHIARVVTSVAISSLPFTAIPVATVRVTRALSFLHEAYLTFNGELDEGYNTADHIFFASKEIGLAALEIYFPIATMLADTFATIDYLAKQQLSEEVYAEFKVVKTGMQKSALAAFASEFFGFAGFDSVGSKFNPVEMFSKFLKGFFK